MKLKQCKKQYPYKKYRKSEWKTILNYQHQTTPVWISIPQSALKLQVRTSLIQPYFYCRSNTKYENDAIINVLLKKQ